MTTKLKALAVQAAVNAKTWEFWREFAICLGKAVMAAGFWPSADRWSWGHDQGRARRDRGHRPVDTDHTDRSCIRVARGRGVGCLPTVHLAMPVREGAIRMDAPKKIWVNDGHKVTEYSEAPKGHAAQPAQVAPSAVSSDHAIQEPTAMVEAPTDAGVVADQVQAVSSQPRRPITNTIPRPVSSPRSSTIRKQSRCSPKA